MKYNRLGKLHTGGIENLRKYNKDLLELQADKLSNSLKMGCKISLPESVRSYLQKHTESKDIISVINTTLECYEDVCTPEKVARIRNQSISKQKNKGGTDFATEIDLAIEKYGKDKLFNLIDGDIKIYGEEEGEYIGSNDAKKLFRIDPIDGTGEFMGRGSDYSIMFGKYSLSEEGSELLDYSAIYFPEKEGSPLHLYIRGKGNYIINTQGDNAGDFVPILVIPKQNNISDMNVSIRKHSDMKQSHKNMSEVEKNIRQLKPAQIHITNSASADVLKAMLRQGRQAMIIDGDYNIVDFIPFGAIQELGYEIYEWDGAGPLDPADYNLENRKLVVVPRGKAGVQIRNAIKYSLE